MPLIELICTKCGLTEEELIKADGKYPECPACKGKRKQKYSGVKVPCLKKGCKGGCKSCQGCGR